MAKWSKLLTFMNDVRKETTDTLDKVSKLQAILAKSLKGEFDADEFRRAMMGSPIAKEAKNLRKLRDKLRKILRPSVKFDEGLPQWTFREVARVLHSEEGLMHARRFERESGEAAKTLQKRYMSVSMLLAWSLRGVLLAKKAHGRIVRFAKILERFQAPPQLFSVVKTMALELRIEIIPVLGDIQNFFVIINKTYSKLLNKLEESRDKFKKTQKEMARLVKQLEKEEKSGKKKR